MSLRTALVTIGSLTLHGAAASLGVLLVAPTPVSQQTVPESNLSLATMRVPLLEAHPTKPDAQFLQADTLPADTTPSGSSHYVVRSSRVVSKAQLAPPVIKSAKFPSTLLQDNNVHPLAQLPLSTGQSPIAALPTGTVHALTAPLINKPVAETAQTVTVQTPAELQVLKLATEKTASTPINSDLAFTPLHLAQKPAAPLVAAAFDWSGPPAFDASSLDTVAAFLRPDSSTGRNMRDALATALKAPQCARVQTAFDPETNSLELRGHLRDEAQRAPLLSALSNQLGAGLPVKDQLLILRPPQCAILTSLDQLDLPQSEEQFTDPMLVGDQSQVKTYHFVAGQRLIVDLEAPDYPSFIYLDYFDANGDVIHLVPSTQRPLKSFDPAAPFSIGRPDPDTGAAPTMVLEIAPPFGQDIVVAYATSHPLYDGLRPFSEPAAEYLTFLQAQIAETRGKYERFQGEWAYLFVSTREK